MNTLEATVETVKAIFASVGGQHSNAYHFLTKEECRSELMRTIEQIYQKYHEVQITTRDRPVAQSR